MPDTPTRTEIPKAYSPKEAELKWYRFWMEKGFFTPRIDPTRKPFVIIMPPPNITGELHLGHALTAGLEDIMARWRRMKGDPTLWLPGEDHAGIAGQNAVEKILAKEGLTRHQIGREEFTRRMWEWAEKYRRIIADQHKRLGASCDWSRERFTMDEGPSRAVRTTFGNLYNKGLIYRGERIINWCPRCATALSDLEVEHQDITGNLWHVRYPLEDGSGFITVATTRPETILGDTAVAVNPDDDRYRRLVGKRVVLPAVGRAIPIIADSAVDTAFGTGAVKVTPAHDPVDFEISQRHNLPLINLLNPNATMNQNAGPYAGMDRFECRKALLADLEKEGLLVKVEPYSHAVGHCQRCRTVVEPIVSKQWFVRMEPLAGPALEAVRTSEIVIIPERFGKVYINWLENIRDWCISRQLWWGHRIPVWYCQDCDGLTVAVEEPERCSRCGSAKIAQDPDVLDTWFSSGLWPHSTLGWPDDTEDLRYFYPTTVMETGYDILFFWVARMIMMGLENTGKVPFHYVYLHGLIRDEKGEKMSKTRGNVVDPLQTMEQYGTDALRFALSTGTSPGNDMRLTPQKLEGSRNFANKLWNASRFVLTNLHGKKDVLAGGLAPNPPAEDRWILSRLARVTGDVNRLLRDFQFGEAQRQLYEFLWSEFCDWYIEIAKIRLRDGTGTGASPLPVLAHTLETSLRLLHPFMPFVTEEIWQALKGHLPETAGLPESIMIAAYPEAAAGAADPEAEQEIERVIEVVRSIRNARVEAGVEPARWITGYVEARERKEPLARHSEAIATLARVRPLHILGDAEPKPSRENALVLVLKDVEVVLPREGMVDLDVQRQRLDKEAEQIRAEIGRLETRLVDAGFLGKAPAPVVEKQRNRLTECRDKLGRLEEQLGRLG